MVFPIPETLRTTLVAGFFLLPATAGFSQETSISANSDSEAIVEVDISGDLLTTEQALHFALSEDRVPNAETVKIERIKARFSDRGNLWEFRFRDEDKTYEATVRQDQAFDLEKDFDEDGANAAFWETLPDAKDVEFPEAYLDRSIEIIEAFNPTYSAIRRAIVEYEVCDPPKPDDESDYTNGCRSNEGKEEWQAFVQVNGEVGGEDATFFKVVEFQDGEPTSLNDARVSGNW